MSDNNNQQPMQMEDVIKVAAKAGADAAIAHIEEKQRKEAKEKHDTRLRNTKLLLKNYRSFKEHSVKAVYSAQQAEDVEDILSLMWDPNNRGKQIVESIKASAVRTKIIMSHVDSMLNTYKQLCEGSKNSTDQRRYQVLYDRYISDEIITIDEIAKRYSIDPRTVYLDIDTATDVMAALIFGVDFILGGKRNG